MAGVVAVLVSAGVFRRIIVVDDGSMDDTSVLAGKAGANVLRLDPNGGKGAAMLAGVRAADEIADEERADAFAFFDADLVGLTPTIVRTIHHRFSLGFDMACGLQDHGITNPIMGGFAPLITGQRFLKRWIVDELPKDCFSGYYIETAFNHIVDKFKGKTCLVPMTGVTGVLKQAKVGFVKGWMGQFKMAREMRAARKALEASGGMTCRLPRK